MIIRDYQTDPSPSEIALDYDISKALGYYNADKKGIPVDLVRRLDQLIPSCKR